jgi:hypothetical protein
MKINFRHMPAWLNLLLGDEIWGVRFPAVFVSYSSAVSEDENEIGRWLPWLIQGGMFHPGSQRHD